MLLTDALIRKSPPALRLRLERLRASSLGGRLARGFIWSVLGVAASRVGTLAASIIVARLLGRAEFGALGIVHSTVMMFQVFAGYGLGLTASKHVAEHRVRDPARAGSIIALAAWVSFVAGALLAALLLIFAPWLATTALSAPELTGTLRLAAALLFFGAINGAQMGALAGFEAFRASARVNMFGGLATLPLMIAGALAYGLNGAVMGLAASMAVSCVLSQLALRTECVRAGVPLSRRVSWQDGGVLRSFTLPAVLGGAMVAPVSWACAAILVRQPDGLAQMGLFNAANQWFGALLMLPATLGQVVLPVLSDRLADADRGGTARVLTLAVKTNALIVLPLVVLGSLASPLVMRMYGDEFVAAWPTLIIVLLTAGVLALQTPVGDIVAASGRMWTGLLQNTGWALAFVVLTSLLVPWGALGLAAARLGAYVVHALWTGAFAYRVLRSSNAGESAHA